MSKIRAKRLDALPPPEEVRRLIRAFGNRTNRPKTALLQQLALDPGTPVHRLAEIIGKSPRTTQRYLRMLREKGIQGFLTDTPQQRKLTDDEKKLSPTWIDEAQKTGARAVVWSRAVDKSAIEYAHSNGLKVWVYTINDPEIANRLLDGGVDGIITDNPAIIWKTIGLWQTDKK